ncbi:hypothetical protein F511_33003 [Dorcoceras hygrometricum]|uniref:Uncharacterized protein n=1 Tax=Dorcoceras hygrometricum TaxID=472368 RepID=A0A2Z7CIW4_9LAMI|nr:hypothetical protein F511_33003 [Dorcoceras hygrometricum]
MRTRGDKRPNRKNDRKVLVAEESTKSWADTDTDSSSSSSSSSDSELEEVHCLMVNQTSDDEVFDFSNVEFTREDLVSALTDMVKEYRKLSHSFEEIKAENENLKNSSIESSTDTLEKPASDRTVLGFNSSDNSEGETSTQSQLVYDKFNKMSFVKANVIHDPYESMTYNDQTLQKLNHKVNAGSGFQKPENCTLQKLNHKVNAGSGFQKPENSKPSWLKNKLEKDKEKAGRKSFVPNQPWHSSTKVKSGWKRVQPKRDLNGQNMKSTLNRSHHNFAQTLTDSSTGKTVKKADGFYHEWNHLVARIRTSPIVRRSDDGGRRRDAAVGEVRNHESSTCVTLNGSGIQLAVGTQPLRLRNHNFGLAQRIMVKRLETSRHDTLGITDSACKNQLVVYNQDLGLIHSTNGNHLESPNEGSSIDHQVTIYLHAQNITMFPTNKTWYFTSQILVSSSGGLILILTAQSTRN